MDELIGVVKLFAGNFAPRGWAFCQGQTLAQHSALFSLLGTTYGGNGTNNFMLPDLRSRVPVGTGQGAGLSNIGLGQQVGTEQTKITSQNLPANSLNVKITGLSVSTTGASVKIPVNDLNSKDTGSIAGSYLTKNTNPIYSEEPTPNRFYGSGAM
jgi:microcystin-dependent protein